MKKLHPVMLAGTGSDVGKSVIAAAFCRIFLQDGYHPAPFKAQNMALNSYVTPDGKEIGRAQAVQAEAAGIPCHTDMNPLLLKPQGDCTSQVVINGVARGNSTAYDYFRNEGREVLRSEVCQAFDRLSQRYNPIVMEGAGSICELNLMDTDLVNIPMARYAGADVFLVADIDRGGVFASVYGSIALQKESDQQLIKGIIINKFRGDLRLFDDGRKILEDITGVPVLGVVPYIKNVHIDEEDSVALAGKARSAEQGKVNVAVVMLRHISNFTDFNALEQDPRIHLFYTASPRDIEESDIVILPGTKTTVADLAELRKNGCAQAIIRARRNGATVMGICGGYQMMGRMVTDPSLVEGPTEAMPGLGLLPVTTTIQGGKTTKITEFYLAPEKAQGKMTGYEIHMGETTPLDGAYGSPLIVDSDGKGGGYLLDDRCFGSYIHGILDNGHFIDWLLKPFADKMENSGQAIDYKEFKNQQYNLLANHVRKYLDIDKIYKLIAQGR